MGTRATIAIINNYNGSDTVKCENIYLHYDGYLSYAGFILNTFYNTPEKAKALIGLGSLSSIGPLLAPITSSHSFECKHKDPNTTVAYHRDRGDDLQINNEIENIKNLSYIYNLETEKWYINNFDLSLKELDEMKWTKDVRKLIPIDESSNYKQKLKIDEIPTNIEKWLNNSYELDERYYEKPSDYKRLTISEIHELNEENAKNFLAKELY